MSGQTTGAAVFWFGYYWGLAGHSHASAERIVDRHPGWYAKIMANIDEAGHAAHVPKGDDE